MCISVYVCTHAYLIYINIYIFHIASSQTHALNQVKKSSECENGIMNVKKSFSHMHINIILRHLKITTWSGSSLFHIYPFFKS